MSIFHDELKARVESGEPVHITRKWYMEALMLTELYWSELTEFEQGFLKRLFDAYEAWRRSQQLN
jgi:hypothetical protein